MNGEHLAQPAKLVLIADAEPGEDCREGQQVGQRHSGARLLYQSSYLIVGELVPKAGQLEGRSGTALRPDLGGGGEPAPVDHALHEASQALAWDPHPRTTGLRQGAHIRRFERRSAALELEDSGGEKKLHLRGIQPEELLRSHPQDLLETNIVDRVPAPRLHHARTLQPRLHRGDALRRGATIQLLCERLQRGLRAPQIEPLDRLDQAIAVAHRQDVPAERLLSLPDGSDQDRLRRIRESNSAVVGYIDQAVVLDTLEHVACHVTTILGGRNVTQADAANGVSEGRLGRTRCSLLKKPRKNSILAHLLSQRRRSEVRRVGNQALDLSTSRPQALPRARHHRHPWHPRRQNAPLRRLEQESPRTIPGRRSAASTELARALLPSARGRWAGLDRPSDLRRRLCCGPPMRVSRSPWASDRSKRTNLGLVRILKPRRSS